MKQIDNQQYLGTLKELVSEGNRVKVQINGVSMNPFLAHLRDAVYLEQKPEKLRAGDIVFYQRESGYYVLHRIMKKTTEGYWMAGDSQTELEGPIKEEQIFAIAVLAERKGKIVERKSAYWWFFANVWRVLFPMRKKLLDLYGKSV